MILVLPVVFETEKLQMEQQQKLQQQQVRRGLSPGPAELPLNAVASLTPPHSLAAGSNGTTLPIPSASLAFTSQNRL